MNGRRLILVLLLLALAMGVPPLPARAATYTVDRTVDETDGSCSDGDCSLRDAILLANSHPGPDTIAFHIDATVDPTCSAATGVCTIEPDGYLPALEDGGTTIDGYSQPGAAPATVACPAKIQIVLVGTSVPHNNGLTIVSADNVIRGLAIYGFGYNGIAIGSDSASGNILAGNYLGLNAAGIVAAGNQQNGVFVGLGATDNTVGGAAPADRNVISGNDGAGVAIHGANTSGNTVSGNYIGTDLLGELELGNTLDGVWIYGAAHDNVVGGEASATRNVIVCNGRDGVRLVAELGNVVTRNVVAGNLIGLLADGQTACGNEEYGVHLKAATETTVGGDTAGERNILSGNRWGVGLEGTDTTGNVVSGNYIGTDAGGLAARGNSSAGVYLGGVAHDNLIGGDAPGERNLISGNLGEGITVEFAQSNRVSGNDIGTDATGTAALSNGGFNLLIGSGSHHNVVGGFTAGERNIISAAARDGIYLASYAANNQIVGNYIGTDAGGTVALGNDESGISLDSSAMDTIIGPANVISGNRWGIIVMGADTHGTRIISNIIGADASASAPLGNLQEGIYVAGSAHDNTIGGPMPEHGNLVYGNGASGIRLEDTTGNTIASNTIRQNAAGGVYVLSGAQDNTIGPGNRITENEESGVAVMGATAFGNTITRNSIYGNGALGIDLDGGNHGMPPPEIVFTEDWIVIHGNALPGSVVEVFTSPTDDGEGQFFMAHTTAGPGGDFSLVQPGLHHRYLTATATDAEDGTSEFSVVYEVPAQVAYLPLVAVGD